MWYDGNRIVGVRAAHIKMFTVLIAEQRHPIREKKNDDEEYKNYFALWSSVGCCRAALN